MGYMENFFATFTQIKNYYKSSFKKSYIYTRTTSFHIVCFFKVLSSLMVFCESLTHQWPVKHLKPIFEMFHCFNISQFPLLPRPWKPLLSCLLLWFQLFLDSTYKIIQCLSFCAWLISFCIMSSSYFHFVLNDRVRFPLFLRLNRNPVFVCVCVCARVYVHAQSCTFSLSIHLSMDTEFSPLDYSQ